MPRTLLRLGPVAALLCSLASPGVAQIPGLGALPSADSGSQEDSGKKSETAPQTEAQAGPAPLVSHFCDTTFFTNEGDRLDLRGATGSGCFDTGRGRDVLFVHDGDFPEGVAVYSDRGRSVLRTGTSPALVFDQESTAESITTGPANDTIRMGLGFAEPGNLISTPMTEIRPGGGDNLVVIGSGTRPAMAPRHGANARIFPTEGVLAIEAGCGRPTNADVVDATVESAPDTARVYIESAGCGIALRDHAASTVLHQVGGRTAAVVGPRLSGEGVGDPVFFDAGIEQSAGMSWMAHDPSDQSVLNWSGMGNAVLHLLPQAEGTGGTYTAHGDGTVFVRADVGAGSPRISVLATDAAEVVVEGDGPGHTQVDVAAPKMRVEWRPSALSPPPAIAVSGGGQVDAQPFHIKAEAALRRPVASSAPIAGEQETAAPADVASLLEVPVAVENRDEAGRSDAGRAALLGGHPVGAAPPEGEAEQAWITEPVFVAAGDLELVLAPAQGWCQSVSISGGVGLDDRTLDCDAPGEAPMRIHDTVRITRADGRVQEWVLEGLDYPATVRFTVAPAR